MGWVASVSDDEEPTRGREDVHESGRWLGVAVVVGASIAGVTGVALAAGEPGASAPATTVTTTVTRTARVTASSAQTLVHLTIAPATNANTYRRTADFGGWTKVSGCEDTVRRC